MTGETSSLALEATAHFIAKHGSFDQAYSFRGFAPKDVQEILERWNANRALCEVCKRSTQLSELKTIKVCSTCDPRPPSPFSPPPPPSTFNLGDLDLSKLG